MSQLPLFGEVPQVQPTATALRAPRERQAIARSKPQSNPRSKRIQYISPQSNTQCNTQQIALPEAIAPVVCPLQRPPEPQPALPDRSLLLAPTPVKPLPEGWVDPASPDFNYLKNCRQCGAPIKIGGLDHSLCSGDCGWVVDLQWLAWMEANRRKRKEPEPQAATHTSEDSGFETLDLFTYGIEGGEG